MAFQVGDRVRIRPIGEDREGNFEKKSAGKVNAVFHDGTVVVSFPDSDLALCRPNLYHVEAVEEDAPEVAATLLA